MNINGIFGAVLLSLVTTMTACCDDDDNIQEAVDNNAGTFIVTNLSYDEENEGLNVNALKGDTLKVIFSPKQEYKDLVFNLNCPDLKKINDSLFVVTNSEAGEHQFTLSAKYEVKTDSTNISYSASKNFTVSIPDEYVIIPYTVSLSDDLSPLVTPEISYTDAEGKMHTFVVGESDIVLTDSTFVEVYKDGEGKHQYVFDGNQTPGTDWVKEREFMMSNPDYYKFSVRYYKIGVTANVTVKYIPKAVISLTKERYWLSHNLRRGVADVHIPNTIYIDNSTSFSLTIKIGGEDGIGKDDVKAALEDLAKTPDMMNLNIFINQWIEEVR